MTFNLGLVKHKPSKCRKLKIFSTNKGETRKTQCRTHVLIVQTNNHCYIWKMIIKIFVNICHATTRIFQFTIALLVFVFTFITMLKSVHMNIGILLKSSRFLICNCAKPKMPKKTLTLTIHAFSNVSWWLFTVSINV